MDQLSPNFIEAKSAEELRDKMLLVSQERNGTVNFYATYYDVTKKVHISWYHDKLENILAAKYKKIKAINEKRS